MKRRSSLASIALCILFAAPSVRAQESTSSTDPALAMQRDRFRAGLERYRAGAYAEAILMWEGVYRELGRDKGFRLAFDLGRAYDKFGDDARAAEYYELYLIGLERKRAGEGSVDETLLRQQEQARVRLGELSATLARLRIISDRPVVAKIDAGTERLISAEAIVVYLAPEVEHSVTLDPGLASEERHIVRIARGSEQELRPAPVFVPAPTPSASPVATTAPSLAQAAPPEAISPLQKRALYISTATTAASLIVPIVAYARATSARSDYNDAASRAATSLASGDATGYARARSDGDRASSAYEDARTVTRVSIVACGVLAATTAALATYTWFSRPRERQGAAKVELGLSPGAMSLSGSF